MTKDGCGFLVGPVMDNMPQEINIRDPVMRRSAAWCISGIVAMPIGRNNRIKHLELMLSKEKDPKSIPLCEICRYTVFDEFPQSAEEAFDKE